MNKKSNIFERIIVVADHYGLEGIPGLAKKLGYSSPEKIYRLNRSESAKPSFDMINDFGNAFETLDLRWFITGEGEIEQNNTNKFAQVAEPSQAYGNKNDDLFKLFAEMVMAAIAPTLKNQDEKIQEVHNRISLKEEMEALRDDINYRKVKTKS
ncbi:MAG: hypothetical protein JJE55_07090 [Flavobacteriaceae bacterium]|nr:hypothetical protein [Flavobacteriaceae bacterium]